MSVFDVDFNILVQQLLPVRLRQPKMIAWMKCLTSPVVWLFGLFKIFRQNNLYNLGHDSQVCYLEATLNDAFDNILRRIYIDDGVYVDPTYIYQDIELKPVYIDLVSEIGSSVIPASDPVPLYLSAETVTAVSGLTFIVHVPAPIIYDITRLKALVNLYKLPGKVYAVTL
jgi:hypothetical protein